MLTGPDDDAFCHRVSAALALGYRLHGSPALTVSGGIVIVAQALVWPGAGPDASMRGRDDGAVVTPVLRIG